MEAFAYGFETLNGSPVLEGSQSPQGAPLGNGLTFTSPVLDGCWMGWPSCFSVLGFRPQVLTEGVLSETIRSQTGDLKCIQSGPRSLIYAQPPLLPPSLSTVPLPGLSQTLPLRGKACLALGSPMLLPRPTLAGAGRNCSHGSYFAASNDGLALCL